MDTKKLRAAWIGQCVGVGGADNYMLGICRYAHNIEWTGIAITNHVSVEALDWTHRMLGGPKVPIQQVDSGQYRIEGVNYHPSLPDAVRAAAIDADIVITWCIPGIRDCFWSLDRPVVELAQNTDGYAKETVQANEGFISYRVACSHAAKNVYSNPNRVDAVIYNAIDPGRVCPRYGREITRSMWNLEDKKILLYMGRMVEEKNPSIVWQAISQMSEDWVALIVGTGYGEEEVTRYASQIAPGRVFFMNPQYHVGDILAASDVYILASDFEGHPLAACEAWLAGVPTVISDLPVIQEIEDQWGEITVKVPIRPKVEDTIAAILRADNKDENVLEIINRARYLAWNEFTLPTAAAKWEEFLHRCVQDWYKQKRRPSIYPVSKFAPKTTSKAKVKHISHG